MILREVAEHEAKEWDTQAAMPAIQEIVVYCERAGLKIQNIGAIVNWYVFLKKNNATTLKEFLRKFSECAEGKNFYEFNKYCLGLYRRVNKKKLGEESDPLLKNLIKEWTADAAEMEKLGDEFHEDPKNNYWQRKANIAAPDERELPTAHVRLLEAYNSFEEFIAAHKEFDGPRDGESEIQEQMSRAAINKSRKDSAEKARTALG